jgi:hypothetical protein
MSLASQLSFLESSTSTVDQINSNFVFTINSAERLRITQNGGVAFGGSANFGTNGQVLRSNGDAAPTWVNVSGFTGFQGSQGIVGFQGSAGVGGVGFQGSQGTTGFQGSAGVGGVGFQGSQGTTGFQGSVGAGGAGFQGSQGTTGFQGSAGTGGVGFQGSRGLNGFDGSRGANGFQGSQGTLGFQGSAGGSGAYTRITANTTVIVGSRTIADTAGGVFTLTLPALPATGASVEIVDGASWATNNLTVGRNGQTIEGAASDLVLNTAGGKVELVYDGTTWEVYSNSSGGGGFTSTDDTTTNANYYPVVATTAGGSTARTSSTKLYFNPSIGTLYATVFQSLSDISQKTNIQSIVNSLDIVKQLSGVEFDWVDTGAKSSGVIAQDLEKVLPHLVSVNEQGIKSVNYSGIIAYLIESNKDLQKRIEALEAK